MDGKQHNRTMQLRVWVSEAERTQIETRMASMGISNMGAFFRKMAIDGYIINLDLSDVRQMVSLLRYSSNNLNQIAKRANETGSIYQDDIAAMKQSFDKLWVAANQILASLAKLK